MIICIGREFGSGGHEIAKNLVGKLHLSLYDNELLEKAIMTFIQEGIGENHIITIYV